jgi:hypothetical protein
MNLRTRRPLNANLPSSFHEQLNVLPAVQLQGLVPVLARSDYVIPSDSEGSIPADDWGVLFTGAEALIHPLIQKAVKTIVNNNDYLKLHSPASCREILELPSSGNSPKE